MKLSTMKLSTMKFEEPERVGSGEQTRYVSDVEDVYGNKDFRVSIIGPDKLIQEAFAESNLEIKIDPKGTKEDVEKVKSALLKSRSKEISAPLRSEECLQNIFTKKSIPEPTRDGSIAIFLDKIGGGRGTFYQFVIPNFNVSQGHNLYFTWVPTNYTAAVVSPNSGDPDLFLYANGGLVDSSMKAGASSDAVDYGSWWPQSMTTRVYAYTDTSYVLSITSISYLPF